MIEADLHDIYGIDVDDDALMTARSWRWLRLRILGLLDRPATLIPIHSLTGAARLVICPSTRVGWALDPPKLD